MTNKDPRVDDSQYPGESGTAARNEPIPAWAVHAAKQIRLEVVRSISGDRPSLGRIARVIAQHCAIENASKTTLPVVELEFVSPRPWTPFLPSGGLWGISDVNGMCVCGDLTEAEAVLICRLVNAYVCLTGDGHDHQRSDAVDPAAPRRQEGSTRDKDELLTALRSLPPQTTEKQEP